MSSAPLPLAAVCRLPAPADNVAIAIRRLEVGTVIAFADTPRELAHTILEGHRFAVRPIAKGADLLSWGLPFGTALCDLGPGEYVCNASMLAALAVRDLDAKVSLPVRANFADRLEAFRFDDTVFRPGTPVERAAAPRTFLGYRRSGGRGVGTRNTIVVLGTTSRTAGFVRQLTARLQPLARIHPELDGIVAVAHTEGGGSQEPNNSAEILRALAGFIVHPNVGAVLAVDQGVEPITNARLATFMREHGYPLGSVTHAFLSLQRGLASGLAEGEAIIREWLPKSAAMRRTAEPLSGLRIALQCGGSDAFSGVSGNPLAGAIVHDVVRHGGTGVLTETDEAVGAETYLLRNIRDAVTAHALLAKIDSFRERLRWHGVSPESNPSAGNKFRGLYNIALKSLGAVHKKDPRTRIDFVCEYADPLRDTGFYFMNGPGNDLEGVAGQIAAGCNLVLFVTGNGSITNFPFVPTLKITTTTRRHELLREEMDINAGRYLDGEPMDALAAESFDTVIAAASGARTKGERAGHSQVSIWRNWRQTDASRVAELKARPEPDGHPLRLAEALDPRRRVGRDDLPPVRVLRCETTVATERIGLVLPTSLCSAQIARLAADRMNERQLGRSRGVSRFVALAHTEGCGFGGESMYRLLHRTYRGYLTHPNVALALLLEHGCEKVPNDAMRRQLESAGIPLDRFGWASVQLDGGIAKSLDKVEQWFGDRLAGLPAAEAVTQGWSGLAIAMMAAKPVRPETAQAMARIAAGILKSGGSILIPEGDSLIAAEPFHDLLPTGTVPHATLAYGQPLAERGLHVVATDTDHWVENITGLAACGAHAALTIVGAQPQQGHPLIPVIEAAEVPEGTITPSGELDVILTGDAGWEEKSLLNQLVSVLQHDRDAASTANGFVDFQLTRGLLGVTT